MKSSAHWFESMADHMGEAYLRYSFTKGTVQEVDYLVEVLGVRPGDRLVDVGCGPGRHSLELARRGFHVVGIDISQRFVAIANSLAQQLEPAAGSARFLHADARTLGPELGLLGTFDGAISLCQGAFGLAGGTGSPAPSFDRELDEPILATIASLLKPGAPMAVSAFSAYFQVRYLEDHDRFDASNGVNHETTIVKNAEGHDFETDLWTTTFTPRELRLLARVVGVSMRALYSVTPGDYGNYALTIDRPEFLMVATAPGGALAG